MRDRNSHTRTKGFTIVELIIVITVMGLMAGILFGAIDDIFQSNIRTLGTTTQTADNGVALHTLQDNIGPATTFLTANTVSDPEGKSWNFAGSGPNDRVLILGTLATSGNTTDAGRKLVYVPGSSGACTSSGNVPLVNNQIFYVKNSSLYRRTSVATSAAAPRCGSSPVQKQTCTTATSAAGCQATDARILDNVTSFQVDYYSSPNTTTKLGAYTTPSLMNAGVRTVVITITTEQRINGKVNTYTTPIRVSHDNCNDTTFCDS